MGPFTQRRRDGKVVDHLRYNRNNTTHEIPIRLYKRTYPKDHRYAPPGATQSCEFIAYVVVKGKEKKFVSTDIEVLRRAVWDALDEHYEIEWETYYLVTTTGERNYRLSEGFEGVEFSYDAVYVGKDPDGKTIHRIPMRHGHDQYGEGMPTTGKARHGEETIALVKGTKENVAALKAFVKSLRVMRENIGKFMHPDNINETLMKAASSIRSLPPPKKKRRKKHG